MRLFKIDCVGKSWSPAIEDIDYGFSDISTARGGRDVNVAFSAADTGMLDVTMALEDMGISGFNAHLAAHVPCGQKRTYEKDGVREVLDLQLTTKGRFILATAKSGLIGMNRGLICWQANLPADVVTVLTMRFLAVGLLGSRRLVWMCTDAVLNFPFGEVAQLPAALDPIRSIAGAVLDNGSVEIRDDLSPTDRDRRRRLSTAVSRNGKEIRVGLLTLSYPGQGSAHGGVRLGDLWLDGYFESAAVRIKSRNWCVDDSESSQEAGDDGR